MVVSAHIGTCGQWSNHLTFFFPLSFSTTWTHYMPLAWSVFPVFSLSSRLLSKHYPIFWHPFWMSITTGTGSHVQSCSIHSFTHPGLVVTLVLTPFQQALVLIQLPVTTPSSLLCPISPSFPPTFSPGPSHCGCVPGCATPCLNGKPPFNEVCSLSVFRLGSKPYAVPFLFTVHST